MTRIRTSCETKSSEEDRPDDYFGLCPRCHSTDGYVNFGLDHWFTCNAHKVRWGSGGNVFSSWKYESEEEQRKTRAQYGDYEEVEPYFYPDSQATEPVVETSAELEGRKKEEDDLDLPVLYLSGDLPFATRIRSTRFLPELTGIRAQIGCE